MAKPLRTPPPSSSVARLLDLDAAARAVAAPFVSPEITETPAAQKPEPVAPSRIVPGPVPASTPHIKREFVFTPASEATFSQLVEVYRRSTGTKLTASHVARALMKGVAHCMEYLEKKARRIGPLKLPSNAKGRELERERFEARIADAFIENLLAQKGRRDSHNTWIRFWGAGHAATSGYASPWREPSSSGSPQPTDNFTTSTEKT